jgi:hypothetical protein
VTIEQTIITAASITGGIIVIFGFLITIYKIARRLDDAIGVDYQGRSISERLTRVEHQLWPNGGSSLADQVSRVHDEATETTAELKVVKELLILLVDKKQ